MSERRRKLGRDRFREIGKKDAPGNAHSGDDLDDHGDTKIGTSIAFPGRDLPLDRAANSLGLQRARNKLKERNGIILGSDVIFVIADFLEKPSRSYGANMDNDKD